MRSALPKPLHPLCGRPMIDYVLDASGISSLAQSIVVLSPALKADAESAVKRIEGVVSVNNQIEVLPLSANDDRLRLSLYRAIYGHGMLEHLAIRAVPPIHLIVENGHVTLEGAVPNGAAKSVAELQANSVSGVFSVTNKLLVDSET